MYNLFTKTLYDKRAFIIGWSLGLAFMSYLMVMFYPAFHQSGGIDELVKSLPPAFQGLVGDLTNLKQLPSYIGSQLFNIRMPIFVSVLAIILSVGISVADEEKGYLRTLVALPLSRQAIVLHKFAALMVISCCTMLAALFGVFIGVLSIHESLAATIFIRFGVMTWLLTMAMATLIFAIGIATGSRGLTMAVGVVTAAGSFILTTFSQSVDWLQPYERLSLLHYFPAADIAKHGITLSDVLIYGAIIVISLVVALLGFSRRDIR